MAAIPAYCPRCTAIFPSPIAVTPGAAAGVSDILTNCPACGFQQAKVSTGVFRATQDAIDLISGPESTREIWEALRRIAERVSSGEIDRVQAVEEARAFSPRYAALLETFVSIGLPALGLLIAMITAYLQYEGNQSSGEDARKILQAITQQTFSLQQENGRGVGAAGGAPSIKEADLKSRRPKHPSGRRAEVNKQRREALKRRRQELGKRRPQNEPAN
jgi:hypothetical protein